jgi:hypothetical protein
VKGDAGFRVLRVALAVLAIVAGGDKFAHRIASWEMYLAAPVEALLPLPATTLLAAAGALEIAVGVVLLTRFGRWAAWAMAGWLAAIAGQVLLTGLFYDVALRDAALAASALALALMPQWKGEQR